MEAANELAIKCVHNEQAVSQREKRALVSGNDASMLGNSMCSNVCNDRTISVTHTTFNIPQLAPNRSCRLSKGS